MKVSDNEERAMKSTTSIYFLCVVIFWLIALIVGIVKAFSGDWVFILLAVTHFITFFIGLKWSIYAYESKLITPLWQGDGFAKDKEK